MKGTVKSRSIYNDYIEIESGNEQRLVSGDATGGIGFVKKRESGKEGIPLGGMPIGKMEEIRP